jgi:site-specific recombinase XerD
MRYPNRKEVEFNGLALNIMKNHYKQIDKENLKIIKEYDEEQLAKGNSEGTRKNRIYFLMLLAREINKLFNSLTKKDINKWLASKDLADTTRNHYIEQLHHFFKWMQKEGEVKHLKQIPVESPVKSSELWSEQEIKKLIETCNNSRDKCMVMMLWDLSIERKIIRNLNVGDIENINGTIYVNCNGKRRGRRKTRRLQAISSSPYIVRYLEDHPNKNNPNAPFFISFSGNSYGQRVSYNFAYDTLKLLARRAGITKKIKTHLVRHSSLTDLYKRGFKGVEFRQHAGWNSSNMESTYVNLSTEEMGAKREAVLNGKEYKPKDLSPVETTPKECPRCGESNSWDAKHCKRCWFTMDIGVSQKEILILELLKSPLYKDEMKHARENGETLDIESIAESFKDILRAMYNPKRKKIQPK